MYCFFSEALSHLLSVIYRPRRGDAAEASGADLNNLQQIRLKLSAWPGPVGGKRGDTEREKLTRMSPCSS